MIFFFNLKYLSASEQTVEVTESQNDNPKISGNDGKDWGLKSVYSSGLSMPLVFYSWLSLHSFKSDCELFIFTKCHLCKIMLKQSKDKYYKLKRAKKIKAFEISENVYLEIMYGYGPLYFRKSHDKNLIFLWLHNKRVLLLLRLSCFSCVWLCVTP